MNKLLTDLEHLISIPALSGLEDFMITEMKKRFMQYTQYVDVDNLGNVHAKFEGVSSDETMLMVFAHIDQIGLMISKVEPNGYLRFNRVGGVPEKTLMGTLVDVYSVDMRSRFTGVIGTYSHHLTPATEKYLVPSHEKMYIDIGVESRNEVLSKGISVGSPVLYKPSMHLIGENRICASYLDNRISNLLLLQLAEYLSVNPARGSVSLVASVQEEFNIRGVLPVFNRLKPKCAVCIDITPACDTPDLNFSHEMVLGKGPAVLHMNFHGRGTLGGLIPNPKLRVTIEKSFLSVKIPYQHEVVIGEITDDAFAAMEGDKGFNIAHISIPIRYSHSPNEVCDIRDVHATFEGMKTFIKELTTDIDLSRGIL